MDSMKKAPKGKVDKKAWEKLIGKNRKLIIVRQIVFNILNFIIFHRFVSRIGGVRSRQWWNTNSDTFKRNSSSLR